MSNLRFTLTLIAIGLVLAALAVGWFAPAILAALPEEVEAPYLFLTAFVFVGLCAVAFYTLMERALNPVLALIDTFSRMRVGDLNRRLPVEGPAEMRRMARGFNDMVEDLETQIRDIEVEKQSAERARERARDQLRLEAEMLQQRRQVVREDLQDQVDERATFKALVDSAQLGVILADADLRVVYQNETSTALFYQLDDHMNIDPDGLIGTDLTELFPNAGSVGAILADPDELPYEVLFSVGPYRVRFLASAVYDEATEFAGPSIYWEVLPAADEVASTTDRVAASVKDSIEDEPDYNADLEPVDPNEGIDEDVLAEVEALESEDDPVFMEETGFEMVDEPMEDEVVPSQNGSSSRAGLDSEEVRALERGAALVTRSVHVLGERLSSVRSSIQALRSEGDSLRQSVAAARQQIEQTGKLTSERSESLWDLVEGSKVVATYSAAARKVVRRLRNRLAESESLTQAISRVQSSVDHLVLSAHVELGRVGPDAGGMSAVVDAIADLGPEVGRLQRQMEERVLQIRQDLDEICYDLDTSGWSAQEAGRLTDRGTSALERLGKDVEDVVGRGHLLLELVDGQAEIEHHLSRQIEELVQLAGATEKVAKELEHIVEQSGSGDSHESITE